jgi:carbonic anhydrase
MSRDQEADDIQQLFDHNREWAAQMEQDDPGFFGRLAKQQEPDFLWIGCSDSRVPANQITGLMPGEVFVHRNVANIVMQTDLNCMSVIDFAIRKLQVRHVIVCGHYGCAGVHAAIDDTAVGAVNDWLSGIRDLWEQHRDDLADLDTAAAEARLCELNVLQQVRSLCRTTVMKEAWDRGQAIDVHGWIYGIEDGLLRVLGDRITSSSLT